MWNGWTRRCALRTFIMPIFLSILLPLQLSVSSRFTGNSSILGIADDAPLQNTKCVVTMESWDAVLFAALDSALVVCREIAK